MLDIKQHIPKFWDEDFYLGEWLSPGAAWKDWDVVQKTNLLITLGQLNRRELSIPEVTQSFLVRMGGEKFSEKGVSVCRLIQSSRDRDSFSFTSIIASEQIKKKEDKIIIKLGNLTIKKDGKATIQQIRKCLLSANANEERRQLKKKKAKRRGRKIRSLLAHAEPGTS